MRWRFALVAMAIVLYAPSLSAVELKQVGWRDLLPAKYVEMGKEVDVLQARLNALPMKSQEAFQDIGAQRRLKKELKENGLTADDLLPFDQDLLKKDLTSKFPDAVMIADEVDDLNARLDLLDKTPNADLNGKTIRMPGYVLPLEFDGGETTEFLLVPFVGACIHVPPPPSNQIVHVKSEVGVKLDELYQPYWIEGAMQVKPSSSELADAGYQMDAQKIYMYELEE